MLPTVTVPWALAHDIRHKDHRWHSSRPRQCSMGQGSQPTLSQSEGREFVFLSPLKLPSKSHLICKLAFFFFGIHFGTCLTKSSEEKKEAWNKWYIGYIKIWKLMRPWNFPLNPDWLIGILNDWFPIHNPLITGQYNQSPIYAKQQPGTLFSGRSIDLHQSSRAFPFVKSSKMVGLNEGPLGGWAPRTPIGG